MMTRTDSGLFIVIEGIDGTGKSTQSKMLQSALNEQGYRAQLGSEPSQGMYGKMLRDSAITGRLSAEEELELFHKDRKQHVNEFIMPTLRKGDVVILDRYYFSTMAYQGQRGFDPAKLRETNESFAPQPDILFILDLAVDAALERIGARGDTANAFEQTDALQYCRDIYLSVSNEPFVKIIDSGQSVTAIHNHILTITLDHLRKQKAIDLKS